MANFFSDLLTLRDTDNVITDYATYAGIVISTQSVIDLTVNPSNNDVLMMLDIPSNAKPHMIWSHNEDIGTGSVADWGIYASRQFRDTDAGKTLYAENEALNVNAFEDSDGSLNVVVLSDQDNKRFESSGSSTSLLRVNETMWELANLNSDPNVNLRIGIALPTTWSVFVGGLIAVFCKYSCK